MEQRNSVFAYRVHVHVVHGIARALADDVASIRLLTRRHEQPETRGDKGEGLRQNTGLVSTTAYEPYMGNMLQVISPRWRQQVVSYRPRVCRVFSAYAVICPGAIDTIADLGLRSNPRMNGP